MRGDLRDIALGVREESEGSMNVAEDWDDICNFIRLQTVGWKNVKLSGLIALLFFVLALWISHGKGGRPGRACVAIHDHLAACE